MARINTNVASLFAQSALNRTNQELEVRLQRLSTGLRLNRGADDPAGLIISERIRSDLRGVEQGVKNSERASSVIATTEGALNEVNELLNSIRALVVEAANTGAFSDEEVQANQLQIDSAIDSITRISNTATFGGLNLLDGSLDYQLSGVQDSEISQAKVFGASFVGQSAVQVGVDVTASAQLGSLFVRGDVSSPNGQLDSDHTLRIRGDRGVVDLSFPSATSYAQIVSAINNVTAQTGVTAQLINGNATSGIAFQSEDYGSSSFVSVERVNAPNPNSWQTYAADDDVSVLGTSPFPWGSIGTTLEAADRDDGRDVEALINGRLATGDGLRISTNGQDLSVQLLLSEAFATDPTATPATFHITGGGALFQLGPDVTAQQQENIGVQSVAASLLGGTLVNGSLQFLSSLKTGADNSLSSNRDTNDFTTASDILESAIDEVSILRGRLGAFERNVLETNVRSRPRTSPPARRASGTRTSLWRRAC